MKKRILVTAIIFAVVHFVVMIGSLMFSISFGMEAFDNPDYQPTVVERIIDVTAKILMQPGMSLWTPWMSKNMPNVVEWIFFAGNSLLWGFAIALLISARTLIIKKNQTA